MYKLASVFQGIFLLEGYFVRKQFDSRGPNFPFWDSFRSPFTSSAPLQLRQVQLPMLA
jgi:hypothetical protein